MFKRIGLILAAVLLGLSLGCSSSPDAASTADAIYFGGPIITVNDSQPTAEAVAVKDGKILMVGSRADVEKNHKGSSTAMIDLGGKTMIPGFVDGHSHFSLIGRQAISANLLPAPDGPVNSIPALQQTLRDFIATSPVVKVHQVVIGMSYDDSQLAEHRHPNRQELDAVSADLPILVIHRSGHIGVYNSKALAMLGITANTPNPAGGVIEREADGKTPSGVMEENAHFGLAYKMSRDYTHHFRIGGVKLTFDGSPQGKTAWFTQPYFKVPAGQKKTYAGYPAFTDAEALKWARYQCAVKSSSFSSRAFA